MKSLTDPTNRDTRPAMLTDGEFVSTKETMEIYGPTLVAQNNHGLALRAARNEAYLEGKSIPKIIPAPDIPHQMNEGGLAVRAKRNSVPGFNEGGIALSNKEKQAMKVIALGESVGESDLGQAAVLWTMLNRGQRFNKKQTDWKVKDFETLKNKRKLSDYKKEEVNKISSILDDILAGNIKDPTGGASHYFANKSDNKIPPPDWARTSEHDNEASRYDGVGDGIQIGNHFFTGDIGKDYAPTISIVPRVMTASKPEQVPEVTNKEPVGSDLFSSKPNLFNSFLETIGKGEAMKGKKIPGYNEGGMPMEDDDIMNFIKNYQGNIGDVNPEDVGNIVTDEDLLRNSSDHIAGPNSNEEAFMMQYGNPKTSIPIPGGLHMTDSAQLRGGNVRPDMMPPGYTPPVPEVMPRSTSPQGGMDRIAMANLKQAELDTPFPTTQMLDTQMFKDSLRPETINAPPVAKKKPFFDLSNAYNAAGEEIILDQEGGNEENITIPVTKSKFADQADAIRIKQAELEKEEAERLLRLATTEKSRIAAVKRIEAAQKKLDQAKGVVSDNATARENLNTIENKNELRNSELELASLRKEKNKATNQLHKDQLDALIEKQEALKKHHESLLNIKPTEDDKVNDPYKDTKVKEIVSELEKKNGGRFPANLEDAAATGKLEAAGAKLKGTPKGNKQWAAAISFLKDLFGDIFNKKDLIKAVSIYLGARLFGASGNQAGAMAGKYYLQKQDQHEANVKAYAASGKYQASSVAVFEKTRNLADLIAIGTPVVPTGTYKMFYGYDKRGNEVSRRAQEFSIGKNHKVWKIKVKDPKSGKSYWASFNTEGFTDDGTKFKEDESGKNSVYQAKYIALAEKLIKEQTIGKNQDNEEVNYLPGIKPSSGGAELAKWSMDNRISLVDAAPIINMALDNAKQVQSYDKNKQVRHLTPYLNKAFVIAKTDKTGVGEVAFQNADGDYIDAGLLNTAILNVQAAAIKKNPDIAMMNPILMQTAIVRNARIEYMRYVDTLKTTGKLDKTGNFYANDIYYKRSKAQNTTPLYEFMLEGGI